MNKFKMKVIYGTNACDYADEFSEKGAIRKVSKGDIEGMVGNYTFDTKKDLETAKQILSDSDGWLDYRICE